MNETAIRPLGNRVLVKRATTKTTKGGIILPDNAQEKPKQGQVLAVGPGKMDEEGRLKPLHVKVGDTVLFSSYAGAPVKSADFEDELLVMSEDEILGVLI